jgi:alpha-1,3-rhamnosyl/mannosyltransferase
MPRALRRHPVDLLHSLVHAPLTSQPPTAVQVPDLSFRHHPELFPHTTRLRLNLLVPVHIRQARIVTTVSEFSRRDLIASYALSPDRVWVIPNAVQPMAAPDAVTDEQAAAWLRTMNLDGPFFLYVGNLHPRKNVPRLIEAFDRARRAVAELSAYQLVIAGVAWWGGGAEERAARSLPEGAVRLLGRVTDAERDTLLRAATALVYPSLFEGFGLPPLEAMASGTPVIASNTCALPEVLGDAAILVDPLGVDALSGALVRVATDAELRSTLRERGLTRAALFTPRRAAEAAIDAFRRALEL